MGLGEKLARRKWALEMMVKRVSGEALQDLTVPLTFPTEST